MSTTEIDLTLGLNMHIGSVPLSLAAKRESGADGDIYTFSGCVQDAAIDIGSFMRHIGQQFGVDVDLPPELNQQAAIDYVAGQIRYVQVQGGKTTTEMGVAAKFDLVYRNGGAPKTFAFTFYADTSLSGDQPDSCYVVGASLDTELAFKDLPLVGSIPLFNEYVLKHLGFAYTNADPAQNNGEPVKFTLPKVSTSANPLKTVGSPTTRESLSRSIDGKGKQTTFTLDKRGFSLTAGLFREGNTAEHNFSLPMALPAAAPGSAPANYYEGNGKVNASPAASSINWINVNKTLGPVELQKIGLNYKNGEATFGLCAGLATGGFSLALQGLSITFPLPLPGMPAGDEVSFNLDGLALDFEKGGFKLGGAFLKSEIAGVTNYFGEVGVQVSKFGFTAIGGYAPAKNSNPASFFIYANLKVPLGGPPFLYVTGLAFGFGLNYALNLPTIEKLPGYLLLPANAPVQPAKAGDAFGGVLSQLAGGKNPVVSNQPGQYWAAAGIEFTSFNMISAFALATVSFGVETQVGLLGSAAITLPKGASSPLAYIEVELIASFTPASGALQIAGIVTPASYLWGDFVKITGGFVLCLWFGGEHSGDFVFSIGGYNPSFDKPSWYVSVPRLELDFALKGFHAFGTGYLALTPAMFMAGMQFKATFSAGPIEAWFTVGVNFLIGWAPFLYRADAHVHVGCSVDLGLFTLRVSVGADLQIWGPSFGGKAEVDLCVISFTIRFGSSEPTRIPVSWQEMENNFLPGARASGMASRARSTKMSRMMQASASANSSMENAANDGALIAASVAAGLQQQDVRDALGRKWNWVVDPNNFRIATSTTIPANRALWTAFAGTEAGAGSKDYDIPNTVASYDSPLIHVDHIPYLSLRDSGVHFSATAVWNPAISVKPMSLGKVQSIYTLSLLKADKDGHFTGFVSALTIAPILGNSTTALWGPPDQKLTANTPALLPSTLLGFSIAALPRKPDTVSNVPLIRLIFTVGNSTTFTYTAQRSDTRYLVRACTPTPSKLTIDIAGAHSLSFSNEHYVLGTLVEPWVSDQRGAVLNALTACGCATYAPEELDLAAMASTESLTDWPMVGVLGGMPAA